MSGGECGEHELLRKLAEEQEACAVFLYTPLCGTCKLAGRMLDIAASMVPQLPVYRVNVNFAPTLVRQWRVASVPCVALVRGDEPVELVYRIAAVDELYGKLRGLS